MYTKIKSDIKEAMKSRDIITRDCLKLVIDKARSIQKEKNPVNAPDVIPDDIMTQAVQKEIKQLAQTLEALKGTNFVETYQITENKIAILNAYLPTMMTREEVDHAVYNILTGGNYNSFGEKMRAVMNELKGKADNKIIKEIVEKYN